MDWPDISLILVATCRLWGLLLMETKTDPTANLSCGNRIRHRVLKFFGMLQLRARDELFR